MLNIEQCSYFHLLNSYNLILFVQYRSDTLIFRKNSYCVSCSLIPFSYFFCISVPCRGRECSHHAECVAQGSQGICQCPAKCPDNIKPRKICASDGNTYDNECELKQGSCRQQRPLQIEHEGPCSKYCLIFFFPPRPFFPSDLFHPFISGFPFLLSLCPFHL